VKSKPPGKAANFALMASGFFLWPSALRAWKWFSIAARRRIGSRAASLLFFSIALVALIAAAFWEWRHPDPVVEIRLLAKTATLPLRTSTISFFGFALFGSTVLIPQMLQSLYGYTATDAGLVLGPGAFVIVLWLR